MSAITKKAHEALMEKYKELHSEILHGLKPRIERQNRRVETLEKRLEAGDINYGKAIAEHESMRREIDYYRAMLWKLVTEENMPVEPSCQS